MKRLILFLSFLLLIIVSSHAQQRYGFVDTKYVLNKYPKYKASQDQLNKLSDKWQSEIEALYVDIDKQRKKLRSDQVFLSVEMRDEREKAIKTQEKQAQEYQQKYFGIEGELFKKRQELIQPIQEDVYDIIKTIAKAGNYGMIIDRSIQPTIIYSNPKFDISDQVLTKLGYRK